MGRKEGSVLVWHPEMDGARWGQVCVRYSYFDSSEPKRYTMFWPASDRVYYGDAIAVFPEIAEGGEQELYDHGQSNYSFTRASGQRVAIRLTNGGQTQAIGGVQITPIDAPKVRKGIETRWYQGGWQKYLKSEGWVYA